MSSSSSRSATSKPASGKQKLVSCPQCGTSVLWDASNPYRPFCSERCKMIDLGAWASESYSVPVEEDDESVDSGSPDENPRRN